jgi:uncharacterized protein
VSLVSTWLPTAAALFAAGALAGGINAFVGGGSLVTFSVMIWVGLGPTVANATSAVALLAGSASAWWGYRAGLPPRPVTLAVAVPSVVGGVVGAALLLLTGDRMFGQIAPWLVAGATVLFALQERALTWVRSAPQSDEQVGAAALAALAFAQLLIATYGGFFGAGMGIFMLVALRFAGVVGIERMNALRQLAALCINGMAAGIFIAKGQVDGRALPVVAVGALAGGYWGARLLRRFQPRHVRRLIVLMAASISAVMLFRLYR